MSDSDEVKITDKRTSHETSGKAARSATQRKGKKPRETRRAKEDVTTGTTDLDGAQESLKPPSKPSGKKTSSTKRLAKGKVKSLADLILYAYWRRGQHLRSLAPGEIKAITKNAKLDDAQFDDLVILSKSDSLLAVPRQILFFVKEIDVPPIVRQETRRFVGAAIKQHPVYISNDLVPVLTNLDDAVEVVEAIRVIATLGEKTLAAQAGLEPPQQKDVEALRTNAINCLAVWVWETRAEQISRVIHWLHNGYWSALVPSDANSVATLKAVTEITEVTKVGAACDQFSDEADKHALKAEALQRKIDSQQTAMGELRQSINHLQDEVRNREKVISDVSQKLEIERAAHANSRAHLEDDREHLRSHVAHCLKRELGLLSEGLQALRRDPPKIRVMDDHAERVVEGLQAAMKELEEDD